MDSNAGKLEWLELMRGMAALWVVMHHAVLAVNDFIAPLGLGAQWARNGYLGVDFFFVLSGFIISHSSAALKGRGGGLLAYTQSRFIRVYFPYWPIGLGMLALYALFPSLSACSRETGFITSVFLLPSGEPPALSVAWTLVHEVMFYAVFGVFFYARRAGQLIMVTWLAGILWAWLISADVNNSAMGYLLSPLNVYFFVGMLVYRLSRQYVVSDVAALAFFMTGGALVIAQALSETPNRAVLGIGCAFMILAVQSRLFTKIPVHASGLMLGAASYAIYLIHNPSVSAIIRAADAWHLGAWTSWLIAVIVGTTAGIVYNLVLERRLLSLGRKILLKSGKSNDGI